MSEAMENMSSNSAATGDAGAAAPHEHSQSHERHTHEGADDAGNANVTLDDVAAAQEDVGPDDAESPEATSSDAAGDMQPEREPVGIAVADASEPAKMEWYILKVQSNREDSIRESLQRNVQRAGLEQYFGEVIVPIETVTEFKGGKKKVVKRKLYPGYLVVRMEINDDTWYVVRETPGIGDFTGSIGRPTPMLAADVAKIISKSEEKPDEAPRLSIRFKKGDRVKINEGTFENFEGDIDSVNEASGRVSVIINIFGRPTPVELEHWQIESL